ncbi:hypothetical protein GCM10010406_56240 [Streptomyces thermolineatus]|uniref:vWA-MoxR associated protein C-terminal domain-containing protein n=1 Tax=Streptomyces thermolineatus TaxID=44033 RepID=A0ABN3N3M1_9ACTN
MIWEAADSILCEASPGDFAPRVDVVVGREGLHWSIDEWAPDSLNEFVPGVPLGVKFRLTLRCPEMSNRVSTRDAEQQRRWASSPGVPLIVDQGCGSPRQLAVRLQSSHRDTLQVVLHGPRTQRAPLLDVCLALGVPVVLWDRAADGYEDASWLDAVKPTGPVRDLPQRVWRFRGEADQYPDRYRARPSLVWEDTVPSPAGVLQLLDPVEEGHIPT